MITFGKIGRNARLVVDGSLQYVQFECFDPFSHQMVHCMSTRNGGVSTGECSTLNLGFNRRDEKKNVIANFEKLLGSIGIKNDSLVFSGQIHDNRIKTVTEADKGKGYGIESGIMGYDGLVTDVRGITLVTFYADCVPVFLYDNVQKVIALVHSGWRSTLKEISPEAVRIMREAYGCSPASITAAIGPSIGSCCFEVGEDVYISFNEKFGNHMYYENIGNGKWKIDLKGIITDTLINSGVQGYNISNCDICTVCRRDLFFSYRGDMGRTGSMAAMMQLK